QIDIPPPTQVPQLGDGSAPQDFREEPGLQDRTRQPARWIDRASRIHWTSGHPLLPILKRTVAVFIILGGILAGVLQRERLTSLLQGTNQGPIIAEQLPPPAPVRAPAALPPATLNPLRPTSYGVYSVVNDALVELRPLPGRAPDIRVAVSAALKEPSRTILP